MPHTKRIASALVFADMSAFAANARDQIQIAGSSTVRPCATIVAGAFGESADFPTPVVEDVNSGRQQQWPCIARAAAAEREALRMHETGPSPGPIATGRAEASIDETNVRFSQAIVTHSMQRAARDSQRSAFFHPGNLAEHGETGPIFTNPMDPRAENDITGRIG